MIIRNCCQTETDEDPTSMQTQLLEKMQLLKRRQKELDNLINQYQIDKEPNQGCLSGRIETANIIK